MGLRHRAEGLEPCAPRQDAVRLRVVDAEQRVLPDLHLLEDGVVAFDDMPDALTIAEALRHNVDVGHFGRFGRLDPRHLVGLALLVHAPDIFQIVEKIVGNASGHVECTR